MKQSMIEAGRPSCQCKAGSTKLKPPLRLKVLIRANYVRALSSVPEPDRFEAEAQDKVLSSSTPYIAEKGMGMDWPAYLPLLALPSAATLCSNAVPPWVFMWALSFSVFAGLKWMTWWKARKRFPHSAARSTGYLFAWPGMDAAAFLDPSVQAARPNLQHWLTAILKTALGILLLWVLARHVSPELPLVRGWTGLLGLILLLHFGSFHLIALFWQTFGINAQPIMSKPLLSKSLGEFWGKR
jgi:hypothetical protein